MIRIENLFKNYGALEVIRGLNLGVGKGEVYGFIGHNGAGKSTTMNILSGLIRYQSGKCLINGMDISQNRGKITADTGYLPEDPVFYPNMTAVEYLRMIGTLCGKSRGEIRKKSDFLLELTSLKAAERRRIKGYSRGMRQRLGIAVTLFNDPSVLLLDEPSSALDPEGRKEVVNIISRLRDEGKTIFLSTHILSDIERICDRIGMLHNGGLIIEDSFSALMKDFILPVYDIEFSVPLSPLYEEMFRKQDFTEEVTRNGDRLSVYFKSTEDTKQRILRYIADSGLPVDSFTLRKSSLEEIFLRLVKTNG